MIKAVDSRDAIAQALGIDTTDYQKAVRTSSEEAIKETVNELTAGIDITALLKAVEAIKPRTL